MEMTASSKQNKSDIQSILLGSCMSCHTTLLTLFFYHTKLKQDLDHQENDVDCFHIEAL